jgi:branched-subunit amino acid transport protein AzlD
VSTAQLLAVTGAVAAGVLLCKALPAMAVGAHLDERLARYVGLLPAATLAALLVVTSAGSGTGRLRWEVLAAVAVTAGLAALTRRSLLAMLTGWAVLAGELFLLG